MARWSRSVTTSPPWDPKSLMRPQPQSTEGLSDAIEALNSSEVSEIEVESVVMGKVGRVWAFLFLPHKHGQECRRA